MSQKLYNIIVLTLLFCTTRLFCTTLLFVQYDICSLHITALYRKGGGRDIAALYITIILYNTTLFVQYKTEITQNSNITVLYKTIVFYNSTVLCFPPYDQG